MVLDSIPDRKAEEGKRRYRAGEYVSAAAAYARAAEAYEREGNQRKAGEMRSNQSVALLQAGECEGAWEVVQGLDQRFAEMGEPEKQAIALSNQAAVLEELGRRGEAAERYRQAAALFQELGDGEKRRQVMQALSTLQLQSRDAMGAIASMVDGLESVEDPTLLQRILKKILKIPFNV
jgi:tetratricopeptide (TPR) repeat protein